MPFIEGGEEKCFSVVKVVCMHSERKRNIYVSVVKIEEISMALIKRVKEIHLMVRKIEENNEALSQKLKEIYLSFLKI